MRSSLWRKLLAGALFGIGLIAVPLLAAPLSILTGPAGTNPAAFPADIPDVNTVINGVNANAAFAGTGTPSNTIGTQYTTTQRFNVNGTGFLTTTTYLQATNVFSWTTTSGSTCGVDASGHSSGAVQCLGILNNNGSLRWIPAF